MKFNSESQPHTPDHDHDPRPPMDSGELINQHPMDRIVELREDLSKASPERKIEIEAEIERLSKQLEDKRGA